MGKNQSHIVSSVSRLLDQLDDMGFDHKVATINKLKIELHNRSPFKSEPVDCVIWVPVSSIQANDYNPNSVAPPEMELLRHSISHDGYTQPVVTWAGNEKREVIDGFHRARVCRECDDVKARVNGYLPVVTVDESCTDRSDRIASTIRHNRARGKHKVDSMTDIVVELKKRNWSNKRIGKELGMDDDEILRLTQVSGLVDLFTDQEFSKSWDIGIFDEDNIEAEFITHVEAEEAESGGRVFHTWDKWECNKSRFYASTPPDGMTKEDAEETYRALLADLKAFASILGDIISEWPNSCEHYLTNPNMNRIAWLGQAALAYAYKIPACFRGGYNKLTDEEKGAADAVALKYLNLWLTRNGRDPLDSSTVKSNTEANLY